MSRPIKLLLLSIIATVVILYIGNRIYNYDMRFYYGKDDGDIVRLESICLLSGLSFLILAKEKIILNLFLGLLVGLASAIFCWLIVLMPLDSFIKKADTIFHFISYGLSIFIFFKFEKRKNKSKIK